MLFPRSFPHLKNPHVYLHFHFQTNTPDHSLFPILILTMPTSWNAETDAVLLKAVLACVPLTQLNIQQRNGIVEHMHRNGFSDMTWEALR